MNFEKENLYHIFNQGNNRQKIFFNPENYLFFLKKIKTHILPFADIIAWCLMPNHFHLMVLVNEVEVDEDAAIGGATQSRILNRNIGGATSSRTPNFTRSINQSIGIMLASYTRAINKQRGLTGSLFREKTKAECITCSDGITPSFYTENGITQINTLKSTEEQYPQVCFDYIHQNPVAGGLVDVATDWEFSSAKDYSGFRNGKLVNRIVAGEFIDY